MRARENVADKDNKALCGSCKQNEQKLFKQNTTQWRMAAAYSRVRVIEIKGLADWFNCMRCTSLFSAVAKVQKNIEKTKQAANNMFVLLL